MASIHREICINIPADQLWDAVRDVGALHTRLVPGFVTHTELEPGARIVHFASGMVARELIVDSDDSTRRLAWSVVGTAMSHHNASLQIFPEEGRSRAVWIADLLPNELGPRITGMIEAGLAAMKSAMESAPSSADQPR